MITFTVLASSSGANAVIATTGRTTILLDCGLPAQRLYEALTMRGFDPLPVTFLGPRSFARLNFPEVAR